MRYTILQNLLKINREKEGLRGRLRGSDKRPGEKRPERAREIHTQAERERNTHRQKGARETHTQAERETHTGRKRNTHRQKEIDTDRKK